MSKLDLIDTASMDLAYADALLGQLEGNHMLTIDKDGRPAMEHEYAVNFRANQAMVDIVREKVNHAISLVQQLCKC